LGAQTTVAHACSIFENPASAGSGCEIGGNSRS
jgi:hypothetical protein